MARRRRKRRQSGFDALASLPWPVGIVAGVVLFVLIRYGLGAAILSTDNMYLAPMAEPLSNGALAPIAWLALGICWLAALFSAVTKKREPRARRPKKRGSIRRAPSIEPLPAQTAAPGSPNLDPQPSVHDQSPASEPFSADQTNRSAPVTAENIANLSWLQFEHLIAASYRRKGFSAELTAEGADGGIDIVLRERDNVLLVQCKHWNSYQVGVNVARELFGVMHAKGARKAILATSGRLTAEAERFCKENAIYWLDAKRLPTFIDPRAMPPQAEIAADRDSRCPLCGATMVRRTARQSGHKFWGCVRYPACRGKRFSGASHG